MVLPRLTAAALLCLTACSPLEPMREPHADRIRDELRPTDTTSSEMWRYLSTDVIETFELPDAGFRVHFTRAGKNAVPAADTNTNSVPDFVESVASVYSEVATKYHPELGFRAPLGDLALASNGGNERFDVYLVDFALAADGSFRTDSCSNDKCIGYVVQENDFAGYGYPSTTIATRILGSHEYFHAIQSAYDKSQGVVLDEGTAVWATEQYDPSSNDFEGFLNGFMSRPERSLDSPPPGPVPSYAYGSALFFEFLSEKFDVAIIRKLWERCENGKGHASEPADVADPHWMIQLDALLKSDYQSSFAEAYRAFIYWNFFTGPNADPSRSYARGAAYPAPAMIAVSAPQQVAMQRVFYASANYFTVPANGRATMGAVLLDDPATPAEDETAGMAMVLAVRRNNTNALVFPVASVKSPTTLDTSNNATLIVAVINTVREGLNGVLSRKPGMCIGSPEELRACQIALDPTFDAGVPVGDAGVPDAGQPIVDAGVPDAGGGVDAGTTQPPMPKGCGCNATSPALTALLALGWIVARRRYAAANCRSTSRL